MISCLPQLYYSIRRRLGEKPLLVFLHVPKTAGTRLTEIILKNLGEQHCLSISTPPQFAYLTDRELNSYAAIAGHTGFGILRRLYRPTITVTFLRDPVERVVSLYYFWRTVESFPGDPGPTMAKEMSIEEFVSSQHPTIVASIRNTQAWFLFHDLGIDTRAMGGVSDEELLRQAKRHLSEVDFVGIQENFAEGAAAFQRFMGWPVLEDEVANASESKREATDLPERTLEKIRESVGLDVELYRYACTLSQEHIERFGKAA